MLIRFLTVKVKKHDLKKNYFEKKNLNKVRIKMKRNKKKF